MVARSRNLALIFFCRQMPAGANPRPTTPRRDRSPQDDEEQQSRDRQRREQQAQEQQTRGDQPQGFGSRPLTVENNIKDCVNEINSLKVIVDQVSKHFEGFSKRSLTLTINLMLP